MNKLRLNNKCYFLTYAQCDIVLESLLTAIKSAFSLHRAKVKNYVVAHEEHKDGGAHRHCFIELESALRTTVEARFLDVEGHHPNIQFPKSNKAVLKYCKKGDKYITNMTWDEPKVTKADMAVRLMNGCDIVTFIQEYPQLLFGFKRMCEDINSFKSVRSKPESLKGPCGIWIHGPAGVGKTWWVTSKFPEHYEKDRTKWWSNYQGQDVVACQDWGIDCAGITSYLKDWADFNVFQAEFKGGSVSARPRLFIVTSNLSIEEYLAAIKWPTTDYEPYLRRFKQYYITDRSEFESIVVDEV